MTSPDLPIAETNRSPRAWKRLVIISASAGAGFALVSGLIIGGMTWYKSRPKPHIPWNSHAVKTEFDSVTAEGDGRLIFYYVLENTTNSDYSLDEGSGAVITGKLRNEKSLTRPGSDQLQIEYPIFIPAKQRGRYSISLLHYKYPGGEIRDDAGSEERSQYERQVRSYINERLSNLDGFALFDPTHHYEIDFPKGW